MPHSNPSQAIVELSGAELQKIALLISEHSEDYEGLQTVLIGGWAVDTYNPYFGSQDIDIVTDGATQRWLMERLTTHEEYTPHIRYPSDTVKKETYYGDIILDIVSWHTQYPFEGHPEVPFTFNILAGNTVTRPIRGGAGMRVPNRSMLVFLKLKAAWDRWYRLYSGRSLDARYERGKMIKDCADILALIDPMQGGRQIDLEILGSLVSRAGFLKDQIMRIPNFEEDVKKRYLGMSEQNIRKICENFVSIL